MFTPAQFRARALQFVGRVPYILGAQWTSATVAPALPKAVDCSELVEGLFRENGTPSPKGDPTAAALYDGSKAVGAPYRPGDMAFLKNNPARANGIGHVGILTYGSGGLDTKGNIIGEPEIVEARGHAYGCEKHTLAFWRNRGKFAGVRRWAGFRLAGQPAAATPGVRTVLVQGDVGADVKTLQSRLIKTGFSCGKAGADGRFGPDTTKAVKALQTKAKITVDGQFGPKSDAALKAIEAKPLAPVTPAPAPATTSVPMIIVAGSANTAKDTLSAKYRRRLDVALVELAKDPQLKIVVTGGIKPGHKKSEASVAAAYLASKGIAPSRILSENASGSTLGNFKFGLPIAKRAGATSLIVVSDFSHGRRCLAMCHAANQAQKAGLPISGARWYKDGTTQDATVAQTVEQTKPLWSGITTAIVNQLTTKWLK